MSIPYKFNYLGISKRSSKLPLRLTALQDSSSVTLTKTGSPTVNGLRYRTNSYLNWRDYTIDTTIDLNQNDYVEFCNVNTTLSFNGSNYVQFVMTGQISGSGNIQSLLNYSDSCHNYCFIKLFENCASLTSAPELPATTIGNSCYYAMFSGCTSLTSAPELPATTLVNSCYYDMFRGCTSLTSAPLELPATTLVNACYFRMFENCSSLVNPPLLLATTLADYCYYAMFRGCTSLSSLPSLSIQTLANYCYYNMFTYCTSLRSAPNLPALTLTDYCYYGMFQGCTGLIVGPTIAATTLASNAMINMFNGCTLLQSITVKFSDWGNGSATTNWLYSVAQIGTFTKPGGLPESRGSSYIPTGWTIANSYKRDLAYIESTGTQFINTGIKPDYANGDSIEVSYFGAENSVAYAVFGSRGANVSNGIYLAGSNVIFCDSNGYTAVPFDYRNQVTLKIDNVKIIRNNIFIASVPRQVTTSNNVYLFALNSNETVTGIFSGMKLYEWKYYQNGELKQWLIPVMNNDDIPCLYDKINGTFKYNVGTGSFNYGELPYSRKLAYIESTGTQYIDTGVKPDYANGDSIEIQAYRASYTGLQPCLYGSREIDNLNGIYAMPTAIGLADNVGFQLISTPYEQGNYSSKVNNTNIIVNGVTYTTPKQVTCGLPVFIFTLNNYGTEVYGKYSGMKLYEWKYYQNGALKQSLIPVLDSNSVPCLYDEVGRTLIYNAGTGTFNYN